MLNPYFIFRSSLIGGNKFVVPKNSNLFIGGLTGRTGKTFLLRILQNVLGNHFVTINEHGSFALSQLRHAGHEYYQITRDSKKRQESYLTYFYRFVSNEAYDRWKIYGKGLRGFRKIVPKKAIRIAFRHLKSELVDARTLEECNKSFGNFYPRLLNFHSLLDAGTLAWISEETCYGRYVKDLYDLVPDCRVVIMIRDGRNTVLSMLEKGWNNSDVVQLFHRWKSFSSMTLNSLKHIPNENVLLVRFEDLISNLGANVEKVLSFYEIDLSNDIKRKIKKEESTYASLKNNLREWEEGLSREHIHYFNELCGDLMEEMGYKLE